MSVSDAADRLAVVTAAIEAVGGTVTEAVPLARPDAPSVLAAHWVTAAAHDADSGALVEKVLETYRVDVSGMVRWRPRREGVDDEVEGV